MNDSRNGGGGRIMASMQRTFLPLLTLLIPMVPGAMAFAEPVVGIHKVGSIALPGVEGRFDHFAFDQKGGRLFVAALGNNTVEVIDTRNGTRGGTIKGL